MTSGAIPGLMIAWIGTRAAARVVRIPAGADGVILGRMMIGEEAGDDRISREHARISYADGQFTVEDLGSRNGTYANGRGIDRGASTTVPPRAVVRCGRTIAVLFDDVRPHEAGTRSTRALLELCARDRSHVVFTGPPGCGRGYLAQTYAATLAPLPVRVEEDRLFSKEDAIAFVDAVASSADLRVVLTKNDFAGEFPPVIATFLANHALRVPVVALRDRPDELATIVADTVAKHQPSATCHVTLVEHCLLSEQNISAIVAGLVGMSAGSEPGSSFRVDDFDSAVRGSWAIQGFQGRRR